MSNMTSLDLANVTYADGTKVCAVIMRDSYTTEFVELEDDIPVHPENDMWLMDLVMNNPDLFPSFQEMIDFLLENERPLEINGTIYDDY